MIQQDQRGKNASRPKKGIAVPHLDLANWASRRITPQDPRTFADQPAARGQSPRLTSRCNARPAAMAITLTRSRGGCDAINFTRCRNVRDEASQSVPRHPPSPAPRCSLSNGAGLNCAGPRGPPSSPHRRRWEPMMPLEVILPHVLLGASYVIAHHSAAAGTSPTGPNMPSTRLSSAARRTNGRSRRFGSPAPD